jgi:hypothetical protein
MFDFIYRRKLARLLHDDQHAWSTIRFKTIEDASGDRFYFDTWKEALQDYCSDRSKYYTAHGHPERKKLLS